jgi:hypothetical protein
MQPFTVFPKDGRETFTIKIERFEVKEGQISLFDTGLEVAPDAFLSFGDVAAIVPEGKQPAVEGLVPFDVFLRKREEALVIYAHGFEIAPPSIKFLWRYTREGKPVYIEDIYVASSEAVCVLPQEGLLKFRKRSMSG